MLAADPSAVDLHEYRYLVALAKDETRPADAAERYRRALALWRGEPFTGIDTPWFGDVRTSLVADRYAVTLDRNDAALRAGQHADVLVELTDALRAHPLDERLAGQLMLARYRSGRQADALLTYRAMRERLADELGVDPGAELSRVHQQILTGEAAAADIPPADALPRPLSTAPPEASGTRASPVVGLPRRGSRFVGRSDLVELVAATIGGRRLVTLSGVGGVGKSRLAVEAALATGDRYRDGRWMCELASLADDGPVAHAVATTLGLSQRQGSTIERTVIEYLRDRELLLVVDNCEHVLARAAGLLDAVLRHCPGVALLATSREPLGVEGEQILPVDPLPAADAAALFADQARAVRPGFDADGEAPGAVAEICRRLDGLPLGIELAAARMRIMNAAEVATRLPARGSSARGRGADRRATRACPRPSRRALGAERFDSAARRGSGMDGPAAVAFLRSVLREISGPPTRT